LWFTKENVLRFCRDASVIYGSTKEAQKRVRTFENGKLKIRPDGWLTSDSDGLPVSGDIRNLWVGVAAIQSLFIAEHNAVCDTIKVSDSVPPPSLRKLCVNLPQSVL
jgi:hypothetical protein